MLCTLLISKPCGFVRWSHSVIPIISMDTASGMQNVRFINHGTVNSDGVKIPDTQPTNVFVPVARMIIQPNTARVKVRSIWAASRKEGRSFALMVGVLTIPLWFPFVEGRVTVATVSR